MKKNVFFTLVAAVLLFMGAGSAKAQITKGYDVKPMPAEIEAMVNQIIDLQIDDPDKGNKLLNKVMNKIKNNKEQLISVGEFFLNKNIFPIANKCAEQIYKLDPQYLPGLMFAGQVNKARGFATNNDQYFGVAGQKYEEALSVDPNFVPALRQNVTIYKKINPAAAKDYLEKISQITPDDYTIQKDLGDIQYDLSDYANAVKYYKEYFAIVPKDSVDQISAQNYVNSIFSMLKFDDLAVESGRFQEIFPNDITFKRQSFFADVFKYDYDKAAESVKYLTEEKFKDYTYLDYNVAATYFSQVGDMANTVKYGMKAYESDTTKIEELARAAKFMGQNGQNDEAIATYQKYFSLLKEKPTALSLYEFGRVCLTASKADSIAPERKAEIIALGDKAFREAQAADYKLFQATYFRARLNMTDRKVAQDAPKDAYLELLELTKDTEPDDDSANAMKAEAYQYLVFYYVQKEDFATGLKYATEWNKMDPEDETAKQFKAILENQLNNK